MLISRPQWRSVSPRKIIRSKPVPSNAWNVWLFPFPSAQAPREKAVRPLERGWAVCRVPPSSKEILCFGGSRYSLWPQVGYSQVPTDQGLSRHHSSLELWKSATLNTQTAAPAIVNCCFHGPWGFPHSSVGKESAYNAGDPSHFSLSPSFMAPDLPMGVCTIPVQAPCLGWGVGSEFVTKTHFECAFNCPMEEEVQAHR